MINLALLEKERDALIYQLRSALQMENDTEVAFLIGKLAQTQDLIEQIKNGEDEF